VATPQDMFEPARLCTTGLPARSRAAAIIAAVVVLPFVADTSSEPASSSRDMRRSARGEAFSSRRPGAVVPPLRPTRRLVARASRARRRASRNIRTAR
jgi:hypothetical protein